MSFLDEKSCSAVVPVGMGLSVEELRDSVGKLLMIKAGLGCKLVGSGRYVSEIFECEWPNELKLA